MREFNLLEEYPKLDQPRYVASNLRTLKERIVANQRDENFFDGHRNFGYGGYKYDGRWKKVAKKLSDEYGLNNNSSFLQLNSEKGFLLKDLKDLHPKMSLKGLETSTYAKENTLKEVKQNIQIVKDYKKINSEKNEFDFVMALGVVYTYNLKDCMQVLSEIERVGKGKSFITLASYETKEDYWLFKDWTLIGASIFKKEEWIEILQHTKYSGDYYFTNSHTLNIKRKN